MTNENVVKYTACAPPRCQCPEIIMNFDDHDILITDDYGGSARMTFEEFTILARKFLTHV